MSEATRIPELFGSLVFNERTMEQYVPQERHGRLARLFEERAAPSSLRGE